ncbi:MAG: helix-turn-helix domain-containing protein [Solirubrobacteraceae bacterium]
MKPKRSALPHDLTEREVEVLRLVASGMTNREIAQELVVSPRTVQHHVFRQGRPEDAGGRRGVRHGTRARRRRRVDRPRGRWRAGAAGGGSSHDHCHHHPDHPRDGRCHL